MSELITCQCRRYPGADPCKRTATQEDFLCDVCRAPGCASFQITGEPLKGHLGIITSHRRSE